MWFRFHAAIARNARFRVVFVTRNEKHEGISWVANTKLLPPRDLHRNTEYVTSRLTDKFRQDALGK